jgi:hypothetical protein
LKGLGPEHISFLFKLVHRLLVTRESQHRTNSDTSPNCRAHGCQETQTVENLEHALFPVLPTRMWGKQSFIFLVSVILTSLLRLPFV